MIKDICHINCYVDSSKADIRLLHIVFQATERHLSYLFNTEILCPK